jgi:hypothetical protein
MDGKMIRRLGLVILLALVLGGLLSCVSKSTTGNLIGVVMREGTGEIIARPVLVIGEVSLNPFAFAQTIIGDDEGRFAISLTAGNYNVKLSSSEAGPFFVWPEAVPIEGNRTTIRNFSIPETY